MPKERIVLETSNQRKAALVHALDLQGDTLTDWLEEQIVLSVPEVERTIPPLSPETKPALDITDPECVLQALQQQDWSFTHEDTGYLTHDLHPYPAKFIPQIPAHLIAALSAPGDVIFDPFGGSGTTAVESVRLGRRAISLDANPLSALIGQVKTGLMTTSVKADLEQLQAAVVSYVTSADIRKGSWSQAVITKHGAYVPDIPNIEKWFHENSIAELALLRFLIDETTTGLARDAALLALSRIILRVSFQESETRYVSEPRDVEAGLSLSGFVESLRTITRRLENAAPDLQRADARFVVGDSRKDISPQVGDGSVNLIVTSPPYPNATDYHLYHRFRLFWLGFDPRDFGAVEIGSHLKHQRNGSGFREYQDDMSAVLGGCLSALQPGRYAVFIVGDAVFKGQSFSTSTALSASATEAGFEVVGIIERPIHDTKRSFAKPARRARCEQLVVLRKPDQPVPVTLTPPGYRMWDFEISLRKLEIERLIGKVDDRQDYAKAIDVAATPDQLSAVRRLTFTKEYTVGGRNPVPQPTWQKVLENGDADAPRRKDPKYVTHGLHPYKGKFYPQLAKALINISGITPGARILDPYCGSGTVLLEGMLNGYAAFGCDMNPLAAKIARAKTEILAVERAVAEQALKSLLERVRRAPRRFPASRAQFANAVAGELDSWFAGPVLDKFEWLLSHIRLFGDTRIVEFAEVILSSIVRDVSQQDPSDLRIRRRKEALADAPVLELYEERLASQLMRLEKYWSVAGRRPSGLIAPTILDGDCRKLKTFEKLGVEEQSADCVVTSPPYATALPYIDTDRLSLMAIMGVESLERTFLEGQLTGSREIRRSVKQELEQELLSATATDCLPEPVVKSLRSILAANRCGQVGFRRENMGSLLWRYFCDMADNIQAVKTVLKPGAFAYYVVGNSKTMAGEDWTTIETCSFLIEIAKKAGLEARTMLDISVTTENYHHIKNAITENAVLEFRRPT